MNCPEFSRWTRCAAYQLPRFSISPTISIPSFNSGAVLVRFLGPRVWLQHLKLLNRVLQNPVETVILLLL